MSVERVPIFVVEDIVCFFTRFAVGEGTCGASKHPWAAPDQHLPAREKSGLTFLSGMILTLCTCPVVSKICFNTSSVTRGSSPPTYSALLFGSGAARLTCPPALVGERMSVSSVGTGL